MEVSARATPHALRLATILNGTPRWVYAAAIVPAAAVYAAVCAQPFVPLESLIRDPAAALGGRFYHGLVSNLGVVMWCAASAVCLFRGAELWQARDDARGRFLLAGGALTALLALDDLFMLHEDVAPGLLGVSEKKVLLGYMLLLAGYLALAWPQMLRADPALLVLALGFFGLSAAVDLARDLARETRLLSGLPGVAGPGGEGAWLGALEDGSKFLGIAAWAAFHLRAAWLAGAAPRDGRGRGAPAGS